VVCALLESSLIMNKDQQNSISISNLIGTPFKLNSRVDLGLF
jgi:hypothetical protein